MRKIIFSISFIFVLFIFTPKVMAENTLKETKVEREAIKASVEATRQQINEERKTALTALKEEKKASMEGLKEQVKEVKEAFQDKRVQMIVNFTVLKLEAMIVRLDNIIKRFESRIEKIATVRDVTAARSQLALGKSNLQEAQKSLVTLKTMVATPPATGDFKSFFAALKEQINKVKTYLTETHKALKMGITAIGEKVPNLTPKATDSAQTVLPSPTVTTAVIMTITPVPTTGGSAQ